MFEFLRRWCHGSPRVRQLTSKVRNQRPRLQVEGLEDRCVPAVFNVNSFADILNPPTGVVTLRSAIETANATPGGNTINLTVPGTYSIALPGTPGEVDNAAGEFAIDASGGNITIQNTSGGTVIVNGNHLARVFDINPIFTVGSAVVTAGGSGFTSAPKVTLTGGGGTGATAIATITKGQVTGVTITNAGSGYTAAPTITFTGGGGKGAAAVAIVASPKITATFVGITIENGLANGGNVPAGAGGGIRDNDNASLTLTNDIVTDNFASADGGGISMTDLLDFPWLLTLNNTTVSFNHAGDQGGGVEEDGTGKVVINGGLITGNTSTNEGAGVYLDAVSGGGVFSVSVTNGGKGFKSAPTVTFTGGGGTGATGTAIISNGRVIGVTITNAGSGFILPPTITFTGGGGAGAAASASLPLGTSTLDITGAFITNNVSLDSIGGGVANSGNGVVNIANSTLENNFAGTNGGGFSDENGQGTLNVSNSFFLNNTAAQDGGGIFVGSPDTTITNTEIDGNSSGGAGGGIFAGGTKLTLQASTLSDNVTSGGGGGVEIATSGGGLANGSVISDSTITGNVALNRTVLATGGGVDAPADFTGALLLLNDTINANFAATGGGVSTANTTGSSVILENTIVAGDLVDNVGGNGIDAAGAFIDNGGNLIGISGTGTGNAGFTAITTQTGSVADPLNPLLGPLQNNGGPTVGAAGASITLQTEALQVGSKAIAKGVAGGPMVDERGFARNDVTPDIGAFEFQNASLSVSVMPSAPMVAVNGSVMFTVTVTNTGANALPDDNSLVTVMLSANLTLTANPAGATVSGNTITFRLGAVADDGVAMFTLTATADATGTATVSASVTSPDANPNTVLNTGSVNVA